MAGATNFPQAHSTQVGPFFEPSAKKKQKVNYAETSPDTD